MTRRKGLLTPRIDPQSDYRKYDGHPAPRAHPRPAPARRPRRRDPRGPRRRHRDRRGVAAGPRADDGPARAAGGGQAPPGRDLDVHLPRQLRALHGAAACGLRWGCEGWSGGASSRPWWRRRSWGCWRAAGAARGAAGRSWRRRRQTRGSGSCRPSSAARVARPPAGATAPRQAQPSGPLPATGARGSTWRRSVIQGVVRHPAPPGPAGKR